MKQEELFCLPEEIQGQDYVLAVYYIRLPRNGGGADHRHLGARSGHR